MIEVADHGEVRELRLARPPANALNRELVAALTAAVEAAPAAGARALVVAGAPGMFSAGLDVPELIELDRAGIDQAWRGFFRLMHALAASEIPVAAAITGHAPAGGAVLALCCDWRIVADGRYRLGLNEVQVGLPLPAAIHGALRLVAGPRQAARLAVGGLLLAPGEAVAGGLADELAPADQATERAVAWCRGMLALPPIAMQTTRRDARAELCAVIGKGCDPAEIDRVVDSWFHPEAQAVLRRLVANLGKKPAG